MATNLPQLHFRPTTLEKPKTDYCSKRHKKLASDEQLLEQSVQQVSESHNNHFSFTKTIKRRSTQSNTP